LCRLKIKLKQGLNPDAEAPTDSGLDPAWLPAPAPWLGHRSRNRSGPNANASGLAATSSTRPATTESDGETHLAAEAPTASGLDHGPAEEQIFIP
jgi:hypothetical protein